MNNPDGGIFFVNMGQPQQHPISTTNSGNTPTNTTINPSNNPSSVQPSAQNAATMAYLTNLNVSNPARAALSLSNMHVNTGNTNAAAPATSSTSGATATLNSINFTSALLGQQQQQQQSQGFYGTVGSIGIGMPTNTTTISINPNTAAAIITTPNGQIEYSQKQIQEVQNLIERLLTLYISKDEIIKRLETNSIEKNIILLVWNKLEQQNPDFFKAYGIRLRIKEQIELFNALVSHQASVLQYQQQVQFDQQQSLNNGVNPLFMQNGEIQQQRRMSQSSQQLANLDSQTFQQQQQLQQHLRQFATPASNNPAVINTSSSNPTFVTHNNENITTPINNNPSTPSIYTNTQSQSANTTGQTNPSQTVSKQQMGQLMPSTQNEHQFLSMLAQQQPQQPPNLSNVYGNNTTANTTNIMNGGMGVLQQTNVGANTPTPTTATTNASDKKKRKPAGTSSSKKKETNSAPSRKKRAKKNEEATASTPTSSATTPSGQDAFSPQNTDISSSSSTLVKKDTIQQTNPSGATQANPQYLISAQQQRPQTYSFNNNNIAQYLSSPSLYNSQPIPQQPQSQQPLQQNVTTTPTSQNTMSVNAYFNNTSNNPIHQMNTSMDQTAFTNNDLLSDYVDADISDEFFGTEFVDQNLMNFTDRDQSDIDKALG